MGLGLKFWWIQWFKQYREASINYQFNIFAYEGHDPWQVLYLALRMQVYYLLNFLLDEDG